MGRTWVLDTETKGTGANVVPLDKAQKEAEEQPRRRSRPVARPSERKPARAPRGPVRRSATPLAPGHVRKKATGEIGKVRSVDPKAGLAVVYWLKRGETSTVPLSAISRR